MDIIFSLDEIESAAKKFIEATSLHNVFLFEGEMGSGKTTFIKTVCRLQGVTDAMSSLTFSIINEYKTASGKKIYHLDLYRLDTVDEAREAGIEEVLFSGELCYIEWPGKAKEIMPDESCTVSI